MTVLTLVGSRAVCFLYLERVCYLHGAGSRNGVWNWTVKAIKGLQVQYKELGLYPEWWKGSEQERDTVSVDMENTRYVAYVVVGGGWGDGGSDSGQIRTEAQEGAFIPRSTRAAPQPGPGHHGPGRASPAQSSEPHWGTMSARLGNHAQRPLETASSTFTSGKRERHFP